MNRSLHNKNIKLEEGEILYLAVNKKDKRSYFNHEDLEQVKTFINVYPNGKKSFKIILWNGIFYHCVGEKGKYRETSFPICDKEFQPLLQERSKLKFIKKFWNKYKDDILVFSIVISLFTIITLLILNIK